MAVAFERGQSRVIVDDPGAVSDAACPRKALAYVRARATEHLADALMRTREAENPFVALCLEVANAIPPAIVRTLTANGPEIHNRTKPAILDFWSTIN
jgi:hypothetical protein